MSDLKKIICCSLLLLLALASRAQNQPSAINITISGNALLSSDSSRKVCIKNLVVTGTKKTKIYIVYREIHFKAGDSLVISTLYKELEQARFQVYNTTLFNDVKFDALAVDSFNIDITVRVTERWYLYPVPQFQLVDRNFNEWWKTYKRSFDRVNYGIKFVHYNLTGRRDQLNLYLINGYTRNISFSYINPYSNAALTRGFILYGGYFQNREIPYKTDSANKIMLYKKSDFTRNTLYAGAGITIRKGLFKKHTITVSYTHFTVDDSVIHAKYNPDYFNDPVSSKDILEVSYALSYSNVNNISYALTGKTAYLGIVKKGLGFTGGINMLSIEGGFNRYYSMGKNWYSNIQLYGKIKLPFKQAYINQRGLGYGDNYLRGLEYFVIDGVVIGLAKSTVKKKIVSFSVPFPFFPKLFTKIPFTFFAKTYADMGYVYNHQSNYTKLNNRFLYSGGFGIDVLTLYDINLRFEYSFNQLGQNGLFLHNQSGF